MTAGGPLQKVGQAVATTLSAVAMALSTPPANANPHTTSHAVPASQVAARWSDINADAIYTVDIGKNTSLTAAAKFNQDFALPAKAVMIKGNDTTHFNFSSSASTTGVAQNSGYGRAMHMGLKQG